MNRILWIDILTFFVAQRTTTDTSISASVIALYTLIPLLLVIIAALLLWIMRLKKKGIDLHFIRECFVILFIESGNCAVIMEIYNKISHFIVPYATPILKQTSILDIEKTQI